MLSLTTRDLRGIAAILDGLNKARTTNARLGVPTTPDVLHARFPCGYTAVLRWTEGVHSNDPKLQRAIERSARHRDGYQVDTGAPVDPAKVVVLQDPQPVTRQAKTAGPGRSLSRRDGITHAVRGGRPDAG